MNKQLRYELKFYIHKAQYTILRSRLGAVLGRDEHMPDANGYHIRSLYFDDIYNTALKEKISGIERRKKHRIRIYNLRSDVIKLECKEKFGDLIAKRSARIDKEVYNQILLGHYTHDMLMIPPEIYCDFKTRILKPVVLVDYIREAYVYPIGNVRVTFDKNLETSVDSLSIFDHDTFNVNVFDGDIVVLEIKYDAILPNFIRDLLRLEYFDRCAISKFALCRQKMRKI